MEELIQKSVISLIIAFVVMGILAIYTSAFAALSKMSLQGLFFFIIACIFFLLGILLWVISWAYLIKKHAKVSYSNLLIVGFSSLFGSLTPVQFGTDALRSIGLKKHFKIAYSKSISASMIVKGTKFLILTVTFLLVVLTFLANERIDSFVFFGLVSGFIVVLAATLLFLLPLHKEVGLSISRFFGWLARDIPLFDYLRRFFFSYSNYLKTISLNSLLLTLILSFFSWIFEFLALQFTFFAVGKDIGLFPVLVLFVLISVLERTPLVPRGIGIVEFVGFTYLNMVSRIIKGATISVAQIGAVLILFAIVRLAVPIIVSLIIAVLFKPKQG